MFPKPPKSPLRPLLTLWGKVMAAHPITRETQKALIYILTAWIMFLLTLLIQSMLIAWLLNLQ
jgi:hypothetical protein